MWGSVFTSLVPDGNVWNSSVFNLILADVVGLGVSKFSYKQEHSKFEGFVYDADSWCRSGNLRINLQKKALEFVGFLFDVKWKRRNVELQV